MCIPKGSCGKSQRAVGNAGEEEELHFRRTEVLAGTEESSGPMSSSVRGQESEHYTTWSLWVESLAIITNDCLSLRSSKKAKQRLHSKDLILANAWVKTIIMKFLRIPSTSSGIICINSLPVTIPKHNSPFTIISMQ